MDDALASLLNLHDFEEAAAAQRLPPLAWHYTAGGSEDETSLRANRSAFAQWRLLPRVMRGVESVSTATELLDHHLALPLLLAPTGRHGLLHADGELATARAAKAAGAIYVMSSVTTVPMEEIAAECGPWWLQLYVFRDRERTREQVLRAAAAGAAALVLTVDAQVRGRREAEERAAATLPPAPGPGGAAQARSPLARQIANLFDLTLAWADIAWLTSLSGLPVVVKGIVHPADALQAMAHGAQAILVSNHGGRQLDGVVAGLDALPAVVDAVQGRVPVLVDGGVRRGTDILIALALGAQAVLIGRPVHWGLAAGGEAGVRRVLALLQAELERDLWLCGLASPAEAARDLVVPAPETMGKPGHRKLM